MEVGDHTRGENVCYEHPHPLPYLSMFHSLGDLLSLSHSTIANYRLRKALCYHCIEILIFKRENQEEFTLCIHLQCILNKYFFMTRVSNRW